MHLGSTKCVICHAPLSALDARAGATCHGQRCRWQLQSMPAEHRCAVCGRPLAVEQRADRVCADAGCRRTWFVGRWREQQRREQDALQARAHELRRSAAPRAGIAHADEFAVTVTPSFQGAVVRLPRWRRRALQERVTRIVAGGGATSGQGAAAGTDASCDTAGEAIARACTSCRGHCCRTGGEHAYIDASTIARYRAARPEARAEDVVDDYMSHVPAAARRGSCIYHGRTGCALPRDMRSDTCNRFLCDALHRFEARVLGGDPARAFFAAAHDGTIEAAAFVDGQHARVVRLTRRTGDHQHPGA